MSVQSGASGAGASAAGAPAKVAVTVPKALEAAGKLYMAGRLDQAETVCRQILESRPNLPDAHNLLGVVLNARGQAKDGVAAIKRAIKLSPNEARYYANLGEIERQREKLPEARVALETAIRLNPNSAQAYSNLGIVHFDEKEFDKAAEEVHEKAIALATGLSRGSQ